MPEVIMNGPEGRLEGRYQPGNSPNAPIALMLHPHPQHGGTMNNKVIYALFQSFQKQGFAVLRFNFRGVGRSQGKFDRGEGELSDAAAALDWLQTINPNASQCWIAGFSFGAWISMQLLDTIVPQESVTKLVNKLSHQRGIKIDYKMVPGASHFFTEHLDQLTQTVDDYLNVQVPEVAAKIRATR
jgi:alpha/beta superfamily hydrolase